ncbi:hypothetical protein CASFOL_005804 [Castilleja foliolosa]|uniref:AB hydrolase-1 domain-containing protein n=1 Tax=Castilleja foliolosa TaxID=1961234 RepID=A0ABD3E4J0_9LAMI
MSAPSAAQPKHFVAVHGVGHGSWVYYKLKPRVESAGYRFTPISLAAAGNSPKKLEEVRSLHDYTTPLLEVLASVPEGEKVILIGHSGGGYAAAYAMEKHPEKISVAVFLNALMPDSKNKPAYVIEEYLGRTPPEAWMDTQFPTYGDPPITALVVGPKFISESLYNLSPIEDQALGHLSVRPGSLFMEDLATMDKFSDEKFGSVPRVYVIAADDKTIPPDFQRWLIENNPVKEVKEIKGADHMPMFTQPDELCKCLVEIAEKHG